MRGEEGIAGQDLDLFGQLGHMPGGQCVRPGRDHVTRRIPRHNIEPANIQYVYFESRQERLTSASGT